MTNDEGNTNDQMTKKRSETFSRHSDFACHAVATRRRVIPAALDIRHSSLAGRLISNATQLAGLIGQIEAVARVAIDTEADSLHCYREKLCLLQISLPGDDYIVDPLADLDVAPLSAALEQKEIVLHGADYDLRMLRRGLNFIPRRIFDTVIAARLLGIREFSLAALVKRYFGLELPKGSQKANWARRPLPAQMLEYAMNDTHYLLPLVECLESQLREHHRLDWLRQSCQRAIEQAAVHRARDEDELWRIRGSGSLRGREAAVMRALWQWREKEAEVADRPPFHILQNHELLNAAVAFASGNVPHYRHFSPRRCHAFRQAAQSAMQLPESEWPVSRRRVGRRPGPETVRATEGLRRRRDQAARELNLEPSFIAPRTTLEAIATNQTRAASLLVSWQQELLGVRA